MHQTSKVKNPTGELLDVLIEGNPDSSQTVIMAHGFGTSKHEVHFDAIAKALSVKYRVVRFDFSGFGKSQGKSEDFDVQKSSKDLDTIIIWVKRQFPGKYFLISQSMATAFTSFLSPSDINKTVFTAPINSTTEIAVKALQDRIKSHPQGIFREDGVSFYPRSTGEVQKVSHLLWQTLRSHNHLLATQKLAQKTDLLIIHPLQDEIVGHQHFQEYQSLPKVKYLELPGDHSFSKSKHQKELIKHIKNHFSY